MQFKDLATYFNEIEGTPSRNDMTVLLAELFKKISDKEIGMILYLLQGRVAPQYVKMDFGLGEKMVIKAAVKALNVERKLFMKRYKRIGDVGQTVEEYKKEILTIGQKDLSVAEVFNILKKLAKASGEGSQDTKLAYLAELIQTLDPLSTRFVVRIPTNTLRLGFSDMTILDGFSWMLEGDKSVRKEIEKAFHVYPDLGHIGTVIKTKGLKGLAKISPEIFTPIIMMKAQRGPSPADIIDKVGEGYIEPKYDGFRLQAHYADGKVKLFSRGLDDVTYMYPDIVEGVISEVHVKSIIFEGEAIGFDPYSGNFLPFQATVQRKRKYDIEKKALEIPLKMFAFELLYLDGKSYLNTPLRDRISDLHKSIKLSGDIFTDTLLLAEKDMVKDEENLKIAFDEAISKGLEGIMIKKADGIYQPGARGWNWIKYKRSESAKIDDTIDCLVMGYDKGKGKRANFGIGAFLVGVYDKKADMYKTVAKIGTGLTDDEWREMKKRSDELKTTQKPALYGVDKLMKVDTWIKPGIVVEIKADEITRSPTHTAGRTLKPSKSGKAEKVDTSGYALRFPRLTRFRDDKKISDATSVMEVAKMFKNQY